MPIKIGNINTSDIDVNKDSSTTSLTTVNVKKNNVITQVWGKRIFIIATDELEYVSSASYTYKDAGGYNKSDSISASQTLTDVGFDENIVINVIPISNTVEYTYTATGAGTYTPSGVAMAMVGAIKAYQVYTLYGECENASVKFYSDSGLTTEITQATYGNTIYYKCTGNSGYQDKTGSLIVNTTQQGDYSFVFDYTTNHTASIDLGSVPLAAKTLVATFPNATATLNGNSITSGTSYQVAIGSTYTLVIATNSYYYFSSSAYSGTLGGNTYLVRTTDNPSGTTKYRTLTITGTVSSSNLAFNLTSYITRAYSLNTTYSNSSGIGTTNLINGTTYWASGSTTPSYYWRSETDYLEGDGGRVSLYMSDGSTPTVSNPVSPVYINGSSTVSTVYKAISFNTITMNDDHRIYLTIDRYYIFNIVNENKGIRMRMSLENLPGIDTTDNYRFGYTGTIRTGSFMCFSREISANLTSGSYLKLTDGSYVNPYTHSGSTKIATSYSFSSGNSDVTTKVLSNDNFLGMSGTFYHQVTKGPNTYTNQDVTYRIGTSYATNCKEIYSSNWNTSITLTGLNTSRNIDRNRVVLYYNDDAPFTSTIASNSSSYNVSPTSTTMLYNNQSSQAITFSAAIPSLNVSSGSKYFGTSGRSSYTIGSQSQFSSYTGRSMTMSGTMTITRQSGSSTTFGNTTLSWDSYNNRWRIGSLSAWEDDPDDYGTAEIDLYINSSGNLIAQHNAYDTHGLDYSSIPVSVSWSNLTFTPQ